MYVEEDDTSLLKLGFVAIRIKINEGIQNCALAFAGEAEFQKNPVHRDQRTDSSLLSRKIGLAIRACI